MIGSAEAHLEDQLVGVGFAQEDLEEASLLEMKLAPMALGLLSL